MYVCVYDKLTSKIVRICKCICFVYLDSAHDSFTIVRNGQSVVLCREKIHWRKIGFSLWMKFIRGSNEPPAILSMYLRIFFFHFYTLSLLLSSWIARAHALALFRSCLVCVCVHEIRWRWHLMHYHRIKQKKNTQGISYSIS